MVLIALSRSTVLFVPLITASNLSTELKATISNLLIFRIPRLFVAKAWICIGVKPVSIIYCTFDWLG